MMDATIVPVDDPNRCQGSFRGGQCRYRAEPGNTRCKACKGQDLARIEAKRQYILRDVREQTRVLELREHEDIKSLREEIALARRLLERRFNLINTDAELIAACGPLNNMLLTIEKLVKTCHTLEQDLGTLMSRTAALRLAEKMVDVLMEELADRPGFEDVVDSIAGRLIQLAE
jgi:hypothetical protein